MKIGNSRTTRKEDIDRDEDDTTQEHKIPIQFLKRQKEMRKKETIVSVDIFNCSLY